MGEVQIMNYHIRQIEQNQMESDIAFKLAKVLFDQEPDGVEESEEWWINWLEDKIPGDKLTIVAEIPIPHNERVPVAVVRFWRTPYVENKWLIEGLEVIASYRQRGLAREMVKYGLGLLAERGVTTVSANIDQQNIPSIKLHESLGFRKVSTGSVNSLGDYREHIDEYRLSLEWIQRIESIIESASEGQFRGTVLVTKGNELRYEKAFGYRDLANKILNTLDTRFETASAGKAFVAVGIMKLIDERKLALEDTIGELLSFDLKGIDPGITVKQLLNHTSGIPDYFDESVMDEYEELWIDLPNYRIRQSMDLVPLFVNKPMMYPAGEKFQYNNTGFVVLGLIIEAVTGLGFDEYLRIEVFEPLGMLNTGYYELDRLPENCANAYIIDEDSTLDTVQYTIDDKGRSYRTNIFSIDAKGSGAGGAFTTIGDVEKFWSGLMDGQVISKPLVEEMIKPQDCDEYGFGFWMWKIEERFIPFFQGSDPGVSFISICDPQEAIKIVLMSNYDDNVWAMSSDLMKILEDQ